MNKQIFLDTLRRALYGKLDDMTLADYMQYYENYILQEMASGKSEQEVLDELGDPRLIARTIVETAGNRSTYSEYTVMDGGEPEEENFRIRRLEGWKATAVALAVLFVIFLILVLVFHVVVALLPVLIVLGVIGWVIRKIWY